MLPDIVIRTLGRSLLCSNNKRYLPGAKAEFVGFFCGAETICDVLFVEDLTVFVLIFG